MSNEPKQEWIDAAQAAGKRVFESISSMEDVNLDLRFVSPEDAKATNSPDSSFLDYLKKGGHLSGSFLANAKNR